MIYFKPFQLQEILKLIYLLSEDTGFTFEELYYRSTMNRILLLKKVKDEIIEERNKAQEDAQEDAKKGKGVGNMVGSTKFSGNSMSSIKSMASKMGVSIPSMPSMPGIPHL